jgi:glycosyltransferase involved in cell wall biosynthesis
LKKVPLFAASARRLIGVINYATRENFDLYFEPNFVPLKIKSKKLVVTIHDFGWRLFPRWHPADRVNYFERNFWEKISEADRIIVVSQFIRDQAVETFGLPADRIRIIYNGFDSGAFRKCKPDEMEYVRQKYGLPKTFLLFVGSTDPRKNLENLILAYNTLSKDIQRDCKIIVVGAKGFKNNRITRLLKNLTDKVVCLGYVSNTDLAGLYNLATLFIYPSFYEGYGMPPVEAMACGCPVITSSVSSLPEVCGDAAYYVDPYDVNSIADGIYKVITDENLRMSLSQKGLANAARFSWAKSAQEHLKLFEEIAGK